MVIKFENVKITPNSETPYRKEKEDGKVLIIENYQITGKGKGLFGNDNDFTIKGKKAFTSDEDYSKFKEKLGKDEEKVVEGEFYSEEYELKTGDEAGKKINTLKFRVDTIS